MDTMLITHGMGDWYLPLTCAKGWGIKRIYVDSAYFSGDYKFELAMANSLLNAIGIPWVPVPAQYLGSDDWFGVPSRRAGPVYENIQHDFLFYRRPRLKKYIESLKLGEFINGCGIWSYRWDGTTNQRLSFSIRDIPWFNPTRLQLPDTSRIVIVHVRIRGFAIEYDDQYYQRLVHILAKRKFTPVLIGGMDFVGPDNCIDLRGKLSPPDIMYLIQTAPFYIGNNSMFTWHRFASCPEKPAISCVAESACCKENYFLPIDLRNPNFTFLDADMLHTEEMIQVIDNWTKRSEYEMHTQVLS